MSETTLTLAARIRSRMDLVPVTMRGAVDRLLERVRGVLDLPSRTEMAELTKRLEELDKRISEMAAARIEQMAKVVPALPEPAKSAEE